MSPVILRTLKKVFTIILVAAFLLPNVTPVSAASTISIAGNVRLGASNLTGVKMDYTFTDPVLPLDPYDHTTFTYFGTLAESDGTPLVGSTISYGDYDTLFPTDSQGRFDITGNAMQNDGTSYLDNGTIQFDDLPVFRTAGIFNVTGTVTADSGEAADAVIYLDNGSDYDVILADSSGHFVIPFTATGTADGDQISLGKGTVITSGSGVPNYSIDNLPLGSYTVFPDYGATTFDPASIEYNGLSGSLTNEDYDAVFSVSGTVTDGANPLSGVTVSTGIHSSTPTGGNGAYSITGLVPGSYTLNSVLAGYTFAGLPVTITNADLTGKDITGSLDTHVISGNAGVGGAIMSYDDGGTQTVTADSGGAYTITVHYGWTGTVTPSKAGYSFTPDHQTYPAISADQLAQNYSAAVVTHTISGDAGVAGATLSYDDGGTQTATANGSGLYTITIHDGWTGTVTPSKAGHTFTPTSRTYPAVTTDQITQNYSATLDTHVISGNAGIGGATMSYDNGGPQSVTANGSGAYTITVNYGWTGTVTPTKTGYTFTPASRTYPAVTGDQTTENYTAALDTHVITGNAGTGGATLSYTDGGSQTVTANGSGLYTITIHYGWAGTVTPSKAGYTFTPASMTYTAISVDQTGQSYSASLDEHTISGNAGVGGATLSYTDGGPETVTAESDGSYEISVDYGWTGTVTPTKTGYTFTPASRTYPAVTGDQNTENYTATLDTHVITGNAGVGGATLSYDDGGTQTVTANASTGVYTITIHYGWTGTVTPSKAGYTFSPTSKTYPAISVDQTAQNYSATLDTHVISGNAGIAGATLSYTDGGPQAVTADSGGAYTITVDYGWTGTVTPTKLGYTFTPASRTYPAITGDQTTGQSYTAALDTHVITGNAGVGGATLSYTDNGPQAVTADSGGAYSITVHYGWTGTVTPSKLGYTFSPTSKTYPAISTDQTAQNYTATQLSYTISGTVTYNSAPLPGVTVSDDHGSYDVTGVDGKYTFTVFYGYTGTLTPSLDGYTFSPISHTFTNVTGVTTLNFTATGMYSISGTITDTEGFAIQNVDVSYGSVSVKTQPDGSYIFTGVGPGNYTITPTLTNEHFVPDNQLVNIVNTSITGVDFTGLITNQASDARLKSLTLDYGNLSWPFSPGTTTYNVSVANRFDTIKLTPTVKQPGATIKYGLITEPSGQQIAVPFGVESTVTVLLVVTSPDTTAQKTYTINLARMDDDSPLRYVTNYVSSAMAGTVYTYNIVMTSDYHDQATFSSNTLPAWLTLTDNHDGTATLTGTPGLKDRGTIQIVLQAQDSHGNTAKQVFNVTVEVPHGVFLPITQR
jgi:hypothetical protein